MPNAPPAAAEIRSTLAHLLAGAAGGTEVHWAALITVHVQSVMLDIHCNWRVTATGTDDERAAITEAARLLREAHPYATPD